MNLRSIWGDLVSLNLTGLASTDRRVVLTVENDRDRTVKITSVLSVADEKWQENEKWRKITRVLSVSDEKWQGP